jgi:hypothetical protein
MGWYPATINNPQSFVTIETLDKFRLFKVVANINVRDFVTSLEKLTDGMETESVPVSTILRSPCRAKFDQGSLCNLWQGCKTIQLFTANEASRPWT